MQELYYIIFAILGYLSGSVLYAKFWGYVLKGRDITIEADDKNPGTFNAFAIGGFWCGVLTVICDLFKGIVPVFLCLYFVDGISPNEYLMALVMAAPIIGHIYPIFFHFRGGKGIAVTFGSLLGFLPDFRPALLLAIVFIVYALLIVIKPNFYKTIATYITATLICPFLGYRNAVVIFYIAVTIMVCAHLMKSKEERKSLQIDLIKWNIITLDITRKGR